MEQIATFLATLTKRHYLRVAAFAVCGVVLGGVLTYGLLQYIQQSSQVADPAGGQEVTDSQFARSAPTRLRIPALEIDTTFEPPLGLNDDQTIEVPASYDQVGWYKHGATPGEVGPSVVLGHVDSYAGPGVFFSLGELREGDKVLIDREDGTTATFRVTNLERVDQDVFPSERVYGAIDHAGLRLITCSGVYNRGTQRYSHNLIVFAELATE